MLPGTQLPFVLVLVYLLSIFCCILLLSFFKGTVPFGVKFNVALSSNDFDGLGSNNDVAVVVVVLYNAPKCPVESN
jgi:hypothetical protein